MRRPCRSIAVLALCALACVGVATPAHAEPVPSALLRIAFTMPAGAGSVWQWQASNCLIFTGGWSQASTPRFSGVTSRPRGLLDVPGRSGEAIVPGEGIHVDRIFGPRPRAMAAVDVGIQLAGRGAYLTGVLRSVRSHSARAARRVRLARLRGVTVGSRALRGGLVVTVRGRATMLPPLVGMLNRLRCKGPRVDEHPIRRNAPLGVVTATIAPARAIAQPASFRLGVSLGGSLATPPQLEPTGGAQADGDGVRLAVAPGAQLTATCGAYGCEPSDGTIALVGGFDFTDGVRRVTVTNLSLSLAGGLATVTGTVGGTPMTIGAPQSSGDPRLLVIGDALAAQLSAVFGDPDLNGYVVGLKLPLATLAPV
ncbi:MAG TPA: hypothetical protein VFS37_05255 [Conexibacter sp.]|nr:hypothetical protein [Conexibacter sp.]